MGIFDPESVSPEEAVRRAQAIEGLKNSEAFRWLIEQTVADCHLDWENAATIEEREAAHQHLAGIRALDKQIQKVVDRGVAAARALRGRNRRPTNN